MLETECQQLGGDLAAECKTLVDTFLPEMISLMDQELTDQLCVMIGLCNSTVSVSFDDVVTKAKALFVQKLQASRLTKHITGVSLKHCIFRANPKCCNQDCETAMGLDIFYSMP